MEANSEKIKLAVQDNIQNASEETDIFSPRHILSIVLSHWKIIALCAIVGAAAGCFWFDIFFKPKFSSHASLFAGYSPKQEKNNNTIESAASRQADVLMLQRQLLLGTQLVGDYKELMTSQLVQNKVKARVEEELAENNISPVGFSVSADYTKTTRIIKIIGRSTSQLEAYLAAKETAAVFKQTIEDVLMLDNVRLIDEANWPLRPDVLSRKIRIIIGFLLGIFIGAAFFLLREYFDQTVRSPEDARNKLNFPVIGIIPLSEEGVKTSEDDTRSNLGLVGFTDEAIAEAFRLVRTSLQYLVLPHPGKARVFMITSSVAGEGKSSCLTNLAMITAQSRKKVLVIDADLRRPSANRILDVANEKGLVDVICNVVPLEEAIHRNIRGCSLDFLPSGTIPANPSELLMSREFSQIISICRDKYDYVFIDAPPCMMISDPLIIGQVCDGVMFVVACNSTKIDAIRASLSQLARTGIKVSGILLNKFSRKQAGYGYYKYGEYSYYRNGHDNSGKVLKKCIPGKEKKTSDGQINSESRNSEA